MSAPVPTGVSSITESEKLTKQIQNRQCARNAASNELQMIDAVLEPLILDTIRVEVEFGDLQRQVEPLRKKLASLNKNFELYKRKALDLENSLDVLRDTTAIRIGETNDPIEVQQLTDNLDAANAAYNNLMDLLHSCSGRNHFQCISDSD